MPPDLNSLVSTCHVSGLGCVAFSYLLESINVRRSVTFSFRDFCFIQLTCQKFAQLITCNQMILVHFFVIHFKFTFCHLCTIFKTVRSLQRKLSVSCQFCTPYPVYEFLCWALFNLSDGWGVCGSIFVSRKIHHGIPISVRCFEGRDFARVFSWKHREIPRYNAQTMRVMLTWKT